MSYQFKAIATAAVLALAGCSSSGGLLESKKVDYKSAGKLPTLEVPPDLTNPGRDDRYVVPDVGGRGSATYSAYAGERSTPETRSELLPKIDNVQFERDGSQRWLVVQAKPDDVWDVVKEFWQELGFIVNIERPQSGIMETDWAENRANVPQGAIRNLLGKALDILYSTAERDKFRTRLEPGRVPGTTEIYISHRQMYEVFIDEGKEQTRWQPQPADPELEADMLRRLAVRFGVEDSRAKAQLAQKRSAPDRARLVQDGNVSRLVMEEQFDRAWRRVGLALDRVGFTVEDRDRSQGLFFVRYVDPEADLLAGQKKEKGFLSKLAFWSKDEKPDEKRQYRVHVVERGGESTVRVLTQEGGDDASSSANKIIKLLHEQLK